MQMAAYIAKFAAIFVWFVWLCSNVQIVARQHFLGTLDCLAQGIAVIDD